MGLIFFFWLIFILLLGLFECFSLVSVFVKFFVWIMVLGVFFVWDF